MSATLTGGEAAVSEGVVTAGEMCRRRRRRKKKSLAEGNTRGRTFEMSVVVDSRWNDDAEKMSDVPKILQLTVKVWSYTDLFIYFGGGGGADVCFFCREESTNQTDIC